MKIKELLPLKMNPFTLRCMDFSAIFFKKPALVTSCTHLWVTKHRRRKRGGGPGGGGGGGGGRPPNNLRGGANIPFGPPNNPPTYTGKTIPLNSILEFSIIYFKMRHVIIWH